MARVIHTYYNTYTYTLKSVLFEQSVASSVHTRSRLAQTMHVQHLFMACTAAVMHTRTACATFHVGLDRCCDVHQDCVCSILFGWIGAVIYTKTAGATRARIDYHHHHHYAESPA